MEEKYDQLGLTNQKSISFVVVKQVGFSRPGFSSQAQWRPVINQSTLGQVLPEDLNLNPLGSRLFWAPDFILILACELRLG